MQSKAVASNSPTGHKRQSHGASFTKVVDGNKQPIRGLWIRNGRFYAQARIEDPSTGEKKTRRIPLLNKDEQPAASVAEAKAALAALQTKRDENALPPSTFGKKPKFADCVALYIASIESQKKPGTVAKEKHILENWQDYFQKSGQGDMRVDQLKRAHVNAFLEDRIKQGMSLRTANLDVIALRQVLKRARDNEWIQRLPTDGLRAFKTTTKKRPFFSTSELEKICDTAFETKKNADGETVPVTKNAREFVDYIRLMAYCGARRNETLALRWDDVDFKHRQLTIGACGDTKNRTARVVDFNPRLEKHFKEMFRRRAPDSEWLFPSPQRGDRGDLALKTFRESLQMVRAQAGMPHFQFHDCRHHFISMCIMSGADFMTIAAWVGHRDGGVLIGKVYGHLANEHRRRMADRIAFEPMLLELPAPVPATGA